MQSHSEDLNFTYPNLDFDVLDQLDDATLEQLAGFSESGSDYEVYADHPSNSVSIRSIV